MPHDLSTLGKRLFYLRQSSNKTLQEVSNNTNVSSSNLGKYEKDQVQPTADSIISLCKYYSVSTDWLLKEEKVPHACIKETVTNHHVTFDKETTEMIQAIKNMMSDPDPDIRAWAKIQFRKTFAEYMPPKKQKK
ncbi:MAG: helix-turn-helix transcriptional regulator [Selenomonadaceae bacterium]